MADEAKETEVKKKKPGSSLKPVLVVSLGVFLVSLAGFAWLEGLFGPAPQPAPAAQVEAPAEDSTVQETRPPAAPEPQQSATMAEATPLAAAGPPPGVSNHEAEEWLRQEKRVLQQERREVDKKIQELELLKKDIEQLLARVQEVKSERIGMMAKLYDSMDPEAVAKQINNMDDRTVVTLLPQMNTRTAAKVMALLDPQRAAQITTKLLAMDQ
jgi:flagellar motility protein MotE (MotC chaperone)